MNKEYWLIDGFECVIWRRGVNLHKINYCFVKKPLMFQLMNPLVKYYYINQQQLLTNKWKNTIRKSFAYRIFTSNINNGDYI